jgi:hypothetical protein
MQTNWTTEDAQAIDRLISAAGQALATLRWTERRESSQEPSDTMAIDLPILRAEIRELEEAIAGCRRRGFSL